MKLVHLRMKHPENDVSLSDGELFNVTRGPYNIHIAQAPERQSVSGFSVAYSFFAANFPIEIRMS